MSPTCSWTQRSAELRQTHFLDPSARRFYPNCDQAADLGVAYRTGLNHRPQLVPVHQFGDRSAAVSDQLRDLLQRHACIRKQRDKRVS